MTLIVVQTAKGPEIVNFDNVHCTQTFADGVMLSFGLDSFLRTKMSQEELINEVLSALNRSELPLQNHKNILTKKIRENYKSEY